MIADGHLPGYHLGSQEIVVCFCLDIYSNLGVNKMSIFGLCFVLYYKRVITPDVYCGVNKVKQQLQRCVKNNPQLARFVFQFSG